MGKPSHYDPIDFTAINRAALRRLPDLISEWLPGGRREGREYIAINPRRRDQQLGSFKINLDTGAWADFATEDKGGDPSSLYAFVKGLSQSDAVIQVAKLIGLEARAFDISSPAKQTKVDADDWTCITPIPSTAFPLDVKLGGKEPRNTWLYRDATGQVFGVACRWNKPDGGKDFRYASWCRHTTGSESWRLKHLPEPRPLYGLDKLAKAPMAPVLIVEGEKTATAAAKLFPDHTAISWPGGAKATSKVDWTPMKGRSIWIWPDNDEPGRAAAAQVAELALKAGADTALIVPVPAEFPHAWDLADAIPDGADLAGLLDAARPAKALVPALPFGFRMTARGLVWSDPNDSEKPEVVVSGQFEVLAETRDDEGRAWGVLLRWSDPDGRAREWAMPRAALAGDGIDVRKVLLDGGLYVAAGAKGRNLLTTFLTAVRVDRRARAVSTTGWQNESFILPDGAIGKAGVELIVLQTTGAVDHAFGVRGDLDGWRNQVARFAIGNSRLAMAISTAFAAALVGPVGEESGGIHLRGPSSIGKTTALAVAASVWGGGSKKYVRQWRATANGLEGVATIHNDALLCLDELAQISGKDAGETAYMLANGAGKSRASRDALLRKPAKWRLLFLSSGEIGLSDKIAEDGRGKRQTAGQKVRVVDVPADTGSGFGLFETLHGFESAGAFAKHLVAAADKNFGTAARAFVEEIAPDLEDVSRSIRAAMADFTADVCPAGADGQVRRVADRFGLIGAAGELATAFGLLSWPSGEALRAAKICFEAWVGSRGGVESAEARDGVVAVRGFLSAHGMSRFFDPWDQRPEATKIVSNLAGFRRRVSYGEGESAYDFYITTEAWCEVCAGFDPKALADHLAARGFLSMADGGRHRAKSVGVPGHGKRRVYHIDSSILAGDDA